VFVLKITRSSKSWKCFWRICQSSSAESRHLDTFHHSERKSEPIPTPTVLFGNISLRHPHHGWLQLITQDPSWEVHLFLA